MGVNYDNLWKLLIDKNMKRTDLIHEAKISSSALANPYNLHKNPSN